MKKASDVKSTKEKIGFSIDASVLKKAYAAANETSRTIGGFFEHAAKEELKRMIKTTGSK